ncbi:hypothetical protein OPT61_g7465 [Boeremia exigua]|uniref:Uncharacterized protein n=1 Tax=Boeremia exigua TaxID=749465 RepID=A0ACC2I2F2_9PLEO|nr:hypothetical protein OPT61_g7465 [Boeremia exigua]
MDYTKDPSISSIPTPSYSHGKANEYVQHSQVPPEPDMTFRPPPHRSPVVKLGIWNISVLAMAFLALLWAGSETARKGTHTPQLWFFIVEQGWATRVVTVASVLIRLATAAQMGVFAALVAA